MDKDAIIIKKTEQKFDEYIKKWKHCSLVKNDQDCNVCDLEKNEIRGEVIKDIPYGYTYCQLLDELWEFAKLKVKG